MGRLIVLPSSLSFLTSDSPSLYRSNVQHPRIQQRRRRNHRHIRNDLENRANIEIKSEKQIKSLETQINDDNVGTIKRRIPIAGGTVSEMLQAGLQTASAELVETVCLSNGACTCAEVTCSLKCTNCSQLSFDSMCDELNRPERFSKYF